MPTSGGSVKRRSRKDVHNSEIHSRCNQLTFYFILPIISSNLKGSLAPLMLGVWVGSMLQEHLRDPCTCAPVSVLMKRGVPVFVLGVNDLPTVPMLG